MVAHKSRQVVAPPPEAPSRDIVPWLVGPLLFLWLFSFSPEPVALAAVPGVIAWLALTERCRRWIHVVGFTLLFGTAGLVLGYRWLAPTVQLFGGLPPVAAWGVTILFGLVGAVHGWVFALVYRAVLSRGHRPHPLWTVCLFVGCEALPIRLFPWTVGHGAVDTPPVAQAAEWGGVLGVSFVMLCFILPLWEWLVWAFPRPGAPPARARAAFVTFALGVALYGVGLWRYDAVNAQDAEATDHLRVGIVQGNIGSLVKRSMENGAVDARRAGIEAFRLGSIEVAKDDPELIVWPETVITASVPMQDPLQTNQYLGGAGYGFLNDLGRDHAFLVGLYERAVDSPTSLVTGRPRDERYNTAALRGAGGRDAPWTIYRKKYLIPFGEMVPFELDRYVDSIELPQDFLMLPGADGQELLTLERTGGEAVTLAPFLCYEGILPDHVRRYAGDRRPDVLVSMANDSWFGDTWEPHQHLNFTRFRAIEHRAPLVRATNTGVSAFVSATGDVLERTTVNEGGPPDVLLYDVPLVSRSRTIYVRFGYALPWVLWAVALAGWILGVMRPRLRED